MVRREKFYSKCKLILIYYKEIPLEDPIAVHSTSNGYGNKIIACRFSCSFKLCT